ncbi:MAG: hypothetical protein QW835_00570, partial [Candidatus Hadarchaeum sp.]
MQRKLRWKIREDSSSGGAFHIVSYPHRQEHVIYWPGSGARAGPPRAIEHLHELCHAWLAENVHHQFSAQYFKRGTPDEIVRALVPLCQAASDWFADEMLFSLEPEAFKAEVREHLSYVQAILEQSKQRASAFLIFSAGLILAQTKRYLGLDIQTAGDLADVMEGFLAVE